MAETEMFARGGQHGSDLQSVSEERREEKSENEREKSLEMFFCCIATRVKVNALKKKKF